MGRWTLPFLIHSLRQVQWFFLVMAPDGSTIGSAQATVPPLGTISANINAFVPLTAFTPRNALDPHPAFPGGKEISHVVVRTVSNVLGGSRPVYVMGTLNAFSDNRKEWRSAF